MSAFSTTLQITLLAAVISTIIGTLAAIGISAMKKKNQTIYLGATNIPMLNADIVTGIEKTDGEYIKIPDRKEAIKYAIENGRKGDIIVLAGKGHEDYQEIKGVKYPMDERVLISEVLEELK